VRRVLPAQPEAVARARRAVVGLPVDQTIRDNLALLVSELVTNSVRHAGLAPDDPISVHITSDRDRVRLAVRDGGAGFTPREQNGNGNGDGNGHDLEATGGRGCVIVAALANAWGVERDARGCTVWCELSGAARPWTSEVVDAYLGELAVQLTAPS
jgi:anti-sigma regulatory factor (Ser/Thr protein kinase)